MTIAPHIKPRQKNPCLPLVGSSIQFPSNKASFRCQEFAFFKSSMPNIDPTYVCALYFLRQQIEVANGKR